MSSGCGSDASDVGYFVYMLRCEDGSLYTGITSDIVRRLAEHLEQGPSAARYTRSHKAVGLAALWTCRGRSAASVLEYKVKKELDKDGKLALVNYPERVSELFEGEPCGYDPVPAQLSRSYWAEAESMVQRRGEDAEGLEMESAAGLDVAPSSTGTSGESCRGASPEGHEDSDDAGSRPRTILPDIALPDMHCHPWFSPEGEDALDALAASGAPVFCNTVTPAEYGEMKAAFDARRIEGKADGGNIALGLGFHPWWVGDDADAILEQFDEHLPSASHIGEIGLDFGRYAGTARMQVRVFEHIARKIAARGGIVVSIHSVKSASDVLDILEESGAIRSCTCIFHWFSGTSAELVRAREAGCFFSVNPRMAASKRGREYIKAIPADRILLETDYPAQGETFDCARQQELLGAAADVVSRLKGIDALERIASTSCVLVSGAPLT